MSFAASRRFLPVRFASSALFQTNHRKRATRFLIHRCKRRQRCCEATRHRNTRETRSSRHVQGRQVVPCTRSGKTWRPGPTGASIYQCIPVGMGLGCGTPTACRPPDTHTHRYTHTLTDTHNSSRAKAWDDHPNAASPSSAYESCPQLHTRWNHWVPQPTTPSQLQRPVAAEFPADLAAVGPEFPWRSGTDQNQDTQAWQVYKHNRPTGSITQCKQPGTRRLILTF
jgi:hypothetical protein